MGTQLMVKGREHSTKSMNKTLRKNGEIPAVIYGKTEGSQAVTVNNKDFIKVIKEVGRNGIINLDLEGKQTYSVLVHDLQIDRLKDQVIHADFYEVDMKAKTDADVSVHLVGESAGQKEGGVVQHQIRDITVRALPSDIPSVIEVNIEALNIGDSLKVGDLKAAGSYEILDDENEVIVSVSPPTAEEPETDEDEAQEPELIGDKGSKDEE